MLVNGLPIGQITCSRTIDQKSEPLPSNLQSLAKVPPDDDTWLGYLVPVSQLYSETSQWAVVRHFPSVHVIGKVSGEACIVAVASCAQQLLQELCGQDFSFRLASEQDVFVGVLEPIEAEKRIHGVCTAMQKTRSGVIRNAITGVTSPGGRGLAQYFKRIIHDKRILVPIEWALLVDDITTSPSEVRDQFLLSCLFLSLHLLGDLHGPDAFELLEREPDVWIECLRQIERETTAQLIEAIDIEMHKIALIRGMLAFAGHSTDIFHPQYDQKRTICDNFDILGRIFCVELSRSVPRPFGANEVRKLLFWSRHFKCEDSNISTLCEGLSNFMPVGFPTPFCETLPASLVNRLGYEETKKALSVIDDTYEKFPDLEKTENNILLLLCHFAKLQVGIEVLRRWMASTEGQNVYSRTLTTMREQQQTVEQFVLGLATLIAYTHVLDATSAISGPVYDSYLCDFTHLLDGDDTVDRRAVLERVVCCVRSVSAYVPAATHWLDMLIVGQSSPHWLDGLIERYLEHLSVVSETHASAYKKTCLALNKILILLWEG